jgi:L-arabinose isomerase
MKPITVGLLPLYPAVYDRADPGIRAAATPFVAAVAEAVSALGVEVLSAPVSCLAEEVGDAVRGFEGHDVDALLTVHLAYAPSGENLRFLSETCLPLIVLDTTPAAQFGPSTAPEQMMLNHGIHGVQDLCSGLVRLGVPFLIQAGHLDDPAFGERLYDKIRAAAVVRSLGRARVGALGSAFPGMDDFRVSAEELRSGLGVTLVPRSATAPEPTDIAWVAAEEQARADLARFAETDAPVDWANLVASERVGLALRAWIEQERLTAVTVSFTAAAAESAALPTMPFLECSRLMERGIGYAGEGDILTASWVGALLSVFDQTTFTEMFCPDWNGDAVFLSHMGEVNYRVCSGTPVLHDLAFPYSNAGDTVIATGTLQPGQAVLANLAPAGGGRFRLVLCPGEVLAVEGPNRLESLVNGWFRPQSRLAPFLEQYSLAGATHHSALVYGPHLDGLRHVGRLLGIETVII